MDFRLKSSVTQCGFITFYILLIPININRSASGYKLVDGELIAKEWKDLIDGELHHSIYLDENAQKALDPPSHPVTTWLV